MRLILAMMLMMKRIMLVMFRDDPLNGFACSNGILPQGKGGGEGVTMPMMLLAIFTMATVMKAKMLGVKRMMTTERPIRKGIHTII